MNQKYYCEICLYRTAKKTDFERHCSTRKHILGANGNILETKAKVSNDTKNEQHNVSDGRNFSKLKNEVVLTKKNEKNEKKTKNHQCVCCKKTYTTRSGLWKHQRSCFISLNQSDKEEQNT